MYSGAEYAQSHSVAGRQEKTAAPKSAGLNDHRTISRSLQQNHLLNLHRLIGDETVEVHARCVL